MDFAKELERIAQEYRDEGYAVVTRPGADQVPGFAATFGADILATRGTESALVKVKRDRFELEADADFSRQADVINSQSGWRLDLVVLTESDPFRWLTRGAREPSDEEMEQSLAHVEMLTRAGDARAALVFAWAALEAAMRRVAGAGGLNLTRTTPRELLATLYANGALTRPEFDLLNRGFRSRVEIVHGLVASPVDPDLVNGVVAVTHRLLTGKPPPQSVAS